MDIHSKHHKHLRPADALLVPAGAGGNELPPGRRPTREGERPTLPLTQLQQHINAAKDWIDDAHDALTPDEYGVWADIVGRALLRQRR